MCNKMSDVRLSNASPTLERVDARQPDNVRPSVRRNLFGTPDRAEIRRYVTAVLQEDAQAFVERYNFDPDSYTPLRPGNFEWQEDPDAPEFYRRPPHGSQRPQREVNPTDDNNWQDAAERSESQSGHRSDGNDSRKRRSTDAGSCSNECQSKRLHTDEEEDDDDDEEDQSDRAGSQAVNAVEERPETSAEVQ